MESKKIWKKKEVESLVPPSAVAKKYIIKPRLNLWLNFFFFFNFDYTAGLVCEYGNKHNL